MTVNFDRVAPVVACVLVFVPFLAYTRIFFCQLRSLRSSVLSLQVLCTRAALFPPLYSLAMCVSLLAPRSYFALQVLIAVAEAYSLLCFLAMLCAFFGSPEAVVAALNRSNRAQVCACCYTNDMHKFFLHVKSCLMHLLTFRVLCVLAGSIASYAGRESIAVIFSAAAFLLIARGFIALVNLCT